MKVQIVTLSFTEGNFADRFTMMYLIEPIIMNIQADFKPPTWGSPISPRLFHGNEP